MLAQGVTGLDIATFVIACGAALIALTSLGWNIVVHFRSGVRVRVRMTCGVLQELPNTTTLFDNSNYAKWEPSKGRCPFRWKQHGTPVWAVTVENVGRLPAVVSEVVFGNESVISTFA